MATYRVTAPDGSSWEVNAPDGATDEAVMRYAKSMWKTKAAQEPVKQASVTDEMSFGEKALAGAGKAFVDVGRGIGQMTGLIPQAEIDEAKRLDAPLMDTGAGMAGNVGANLITAFVPGGGTVKGAAAIGAGISALQPTASDESRLSNMAVGGALGGGAMAGAKALGGMLSAKQAAAPALAAQSAQRDAAIQAGKSAGYVAPPSVSGGGIVPRALEGLSGKYKTNQAASIKNQTVTDKLARRAIGLPDDAALTPEVLQGVRTSAYRAGYEPVAASGMVKTDGAYKSALDNIVAKYVGAAKDFPGAADDSVRKFVEGTAAKVIPDRSEWVDDAGRVVADFVEPKEPQMRNILDELKKAGGINISEVSELNVHQLHKNYPGLLRKDGGKSADGILEWMASNGWINGEAIRAAEDMPGGAQELAKDMLRTALSRERVVHPSQFDAWSSYANDSAEALKAGISKNYVPAQEVRGLRVNEFDAGNGLKMSQILRDEASEAYRAGNKALGKAKREAAKAIEDQIERHLATSGAGAEAKDALKQFREARELIAKTYSVEGALVADTGKVDARKLAAALQKGKPLSGELRTIGAFSNSAKDVTRVPESGWANPLTAVDFGMAALGTGISPYALALPAARVAARTAILSGPAQRAMGPTYGNGLLGNSAMKALEDERVLRSFGLLGPSIYAAQE